MVRAFIGGQRCCYSHLTAIDSGACKVELGAARTSFSTLDSWIITAEDGILFEMRKLDCAGPKPFA